MAEPQGQAPAHVWLAQADSDRRAALRVFDEDNPRSFCQALAKQQQTVEKSIKALAAAARDQRLAFIRIKFTHGVDKLINALKRLHRPNTLNASIQGRIDQLLSAEAEAEIAILMSLAPRAPEEDEQLQPRNTEYPYQDENGTWRAPAERGSFNEAEVARFQRLADSIYSGTDRLVSAILRRP